MKTPGILMLVLAAVLAGAPSAAADPLESGADDVVVVAVIDSDFQPQHWDFHATRMPQHLDADPTNDLPLNAAPHTWLPGFPQPGTFSSYNELPLTLDDENPDRPVSVLQAQDAAKWNSVKQSSNSALHYYWIPGTKVIGAIDFAGNKIRASNASHGANTSSVAAGNLHGTCPQCLVVLITYGGGDIEAANNWAMRQPWIDVISNSWGISFTGSYRDRLYSGSDTELQRTASERGQTILFSSGNGLRNNFVEPNTTLFSSQEGPDWIVTVGAVSPSGGNYTGAGKPADIASVGSSYPSIGGTTVSGTDSTFGGTSNATPVTAGFYANALWWARTRLDGPSRAQDGGVIARGAPVECGPVRAACELGDGELTAVELRTRLFHGAVRTDGGLEPGGQGDTGHKTDETELVSEGHGTYFGRLNSTAQWEAEALRITGPMDGTAALTPRPDGEREWMEVDSYCRQSIWGGWTGGYWREGQSLPAPSPFWPARTALASSCGPLFPPVAPTP